MTLFIKCLSAASVAVLCVVLILCVLYRSQWFYQSEGKTAKTTISLTNDLIKHNNSCLCVPKYHCNGTIATFSEEGIIMDNNRDNGTFTFCANISDVCCQENNIINMKLLTPSAEKNNEEVFENKAQNTGSSKNTSACTCVPNYLCKSNSSNGPVIEWHIVEPMNNRDNETSTSCNEKSDVCCEENNIINMKSTTSSEEELVTEEAIKPSNNTGNSLNTSPCTCVPNHLCKSNSSNNSSVIEWHIIGIMDDRDNGTSTVCKNISDVCCKDNDSIILEHTTSSAEKLITKETFKPINNTGSSHNTSCTCVPHHLCKSNSSNNGSVIEYYNTGTEDIREKGESICDSYLEVCCKTNETIIDEPVTQPLPYKKFVCGKRNPEGIGFRILIDEDRFQSYYGEFPWMVAVLRKADVNGTDMDVYQCGGALIHPQVVVTAAHCVGEELKGRLKIRAGEWDTQTSFEIYHHQDREVSSFTVHPQYNRGRLYNDIALLFFKTPVTIQDNVDVLCLPSQDEVIESSKCFSMGWGIDVFGKKGKFKVLLKKVGLPMVPRDRCQENLRKNTKLGRYFELHQSFVCAGGEPGRDTCKGDGGSPLVCPISGHEKRYVQVGIVAWGSGCGDASIPGVYVNVALFRNWIDQEMKLKNFDLHSYQFMEL